MFPHTWMCTSEELWESRGITHSQEIQEESYPPASELSTTETQHQPCENSVCCSLKPLVQSWSCCWQSWQSHCDPHPWGWSALPVPKGSTACFPSSGDVTEALGKRWLCRALHLFLKGIPGGRGSTGELTGVVMGMQEQMVWCRAISFPLAHWLH